MKQEMMGWQRHQLDHTQNHLHLSPDRQPRQHLTTHSFTSRMLFQTPNQQRQSSARQQHLSTTVKKAFITKHSWIKPRWRRLRWCQLSRSANGWPPGLQPRCQGHLTRRKPVAEVICNIMSSQWLNSHTAQNSLKNKTDKLDWQDLAPVYMLSSHHTSL